VTTIDGLHFQLAQAKQAQSNLHTFILVCPLGCANHCGSGLVGVYLYGALPPIDVVVTATQALTLSESSNVFVGSIRVGWEERITPIG
jgi:hypothetical protein